MKVRNLFYHGRLRFFLDGKKSPSVSVHLFSTTSFSGKPSSTEEGEVKWFDTNKIPLEQMWDDDLYWINLMLKRKRFDADFYYEKRNRYVIKAIMTIK